MPSTLIARVTQRVSLRTLLVYLLVAGGVIMFTGNVALVAGLATAFLITEARQFFIDTPGIDNRWVTAGFAVVLLAVSLVWLVAEFRQPPLRRTLWAPVAAVLGSFWLLLDARVDFVAGKSTTDDAPVDDLDDSAFLIRLLHLNRVADVLDADPKTVPEIAAACELTERQVQTAIELVGTEGAIVRVDPAATDDDARYALADSHLGATGFVRLAAGGLAKLLRRLARPVLGPA